MESRKFAVYNQTRESTLSASVASVNAALEPLKVLKVLIEGLPANARTGLWLTNFKGVPVARTLSPFDLIYLDKENKVLHGVELSKDGEFAPFRGRPASALVLPPQTLATSRTREGDQLELQALQPEASKSVEAAPAVALPPGEIAPSAPEQRERLAEGLSLGAESFLPAPSFAPVSEAAEEQEDLKRSGTPSIEDVSTTTDAGSSASRDLPGVPASAPPGQGHARVESGTDQDFFTPGRRSTKAREGQQSAVPEPEIERPVAPRVPALSEATPADLQIQISQPSAKGKLKAEPPPATAAGSAVQLPAPEQASQPLPHYRDYAPPAPKQKLPWTVRLLRWLFPHLIIQEPERPPDRRRADRQSLPGLVAYYFTGGKPEPQRISNISVTGFYLHTDERWMPGTVVRMTLQRVGSKGDDPADTITVNSRIVRWGSDGEGFEFILTDLEE